ncbi:exosome complex component CSL4-like isoform X2 [Rhopilema esculentum]|uniref:exosome complex component CSL4-like isoform X2 n=1 Tax=Rhopilema esculentum TaxID=499914 RepID=UPI0031E0FCD3
MTAMFACVLPLLNSKTSFSLTLKSVTLYSAYHLTNCGIVTLFKMTESFAVPGERLGSLEDYEPGQGTYKRGGFIYSKLVGRKRTSTLQDTSNKRIKISITRLEESSQFVPEIGSPAICKIVNTTPRFCKAAILSVNGVVLKDVFRGMIRREDVRATEIDKVEMCKSFRPGDIVLAKVLSLGDAQSYLLTTAENELGVIHAKSEAGLPMLPRSWCEMYCPKTKIIENRKVAKPN